MIRSSLRRVKNGLKRRVKTVLVTTGLREAPQAEDAPVVAAPTPTPEPVAAEPVAAVEPATPVVEAPEVAPKASPVVAAVEGRDADETTPEAPADDVVGAPLLSYDEVYALIDSDVRPALQMDGGDIELVKVDNNDVYVRLLGACSSCPSSTMTMRMGIERLLNEEFPHMGDLIQVDNYEL